MALDVSLKLNDGTYVRLDDAKFDSKGRITLSKGLDRETFNKEADNGVVLLSVVIKKD